MYHQYYKSLLFTFSFHILCLAARCLKKGGKSGNSRLGSMQKSIDTPLIFAKLEYVRTFLTCS
ncbi:1,4-dihydroxy-2-naphthoate octaprenyltransferase [Bacillus sp. NRRL B-14911]|nr:1,4-dihydroxy-2-naphthoate octaprenyltransferase [Bacillus sp. NRRL B-14911]